MSKTTKGYPWEDYKEEIRRLYIGDNCNLRMLKEHLRNLDSSFCPSDRAIKIHLKRWGFIKNGKISSSSHTGTRLPSSFPKSTSTSVVPFPGVRPAAGAQVAACNVTYTGQAPIDAQSNVCGVGNQQLHIEQAGAAILILRSATEFQRSLKQFQEGPGVQNDPSSSAPGREPQHLQLLLDQTCTKFSPNATFWQSYLGSGDANELDAVKQYLDTMYSYGEQLGSPISEGWHTAALNTVAEFLTPQHSFRETSSVFRILPVAMKSQQLPDSRKKTICYQFLRNFLEFDEGTDMRFGFEAYQHVVRTGKPIRGPPVGPDGIPGKAGESVFAYENYTPAACIHYLRLALKLAMQKPVIQRSRHVVRFTATLCRMVCSLREQLPDDESGAKGPANSHPNRAETRELQLPTNNLPHEVQKTPMGLAFQLQFFAWLYQTVNWDYPNCNAENLLITIAEHLISMATVIAKQNRSISMASEERSQTRKYLSTFALGMNAALPMVLDPKHCCWSMPSLSGTGGDLFYTCRGRCTKYLKIFTTFECFCLDGLENVDFSEREDIVSKLRKDTTDFTSWMHQLSANMKCTSQRWWVPAP